MALYYTAGYLVSGYFVGDDEGNVTGVLEAVEPGGDTSSVVGLVRVAGALAATEATGDTFAGSGAELPATSGVMAATEATADDATAFGTIAVSGHLAATETGSDRFSTGPATLTTDRVWHVDAENRTWDASDD